jgi:hypothetical protein
LIDVIVGNVEGKGPAGSIILKRVRLKSERLVIALFFVLIAVL